VDRSDPWARLISAAGAIGASVALIYVIGGASLSLRYEGFGLPGQQAAAETPREVLLAAGLRTLAVWTALGVALVLALRALPDEFARDLAGWLRRPSGLLAVAAIVLALVLLLKVLWPLVAFGAVLAIILASVHWKAQPLRRIVVGVLSIGLVAVAYEADRITYEIEWTCVDVAPTVGGTGERICGLLVGQLDRGFYLGVPGATDRTADKAGRYRLAFIPADHVEQAYSRKQLARVIASKADARREPLRSRPWDIRVR
jgi:hypothetical protein